MTKHLLATTLLAVLLINCSKKDKEESLNLQLGKPGEIKVDGDIKAKDDVVILNKGENINFITDEGEAIVEHQPSITLKPGDVIVANEDQRYILKVKEVKETLDKGTHVVVRQSNIEDILNDEPSSIKIEATPKYDLAEIEKYVQKAADKNQLITTPPSVDDNGKIVVRNLDLFSIQVNEKGQIEKQNSKFFGKPVSVRNKPVNFSFTAGGTYEARINEMIVEIVPTVRNTMEWNRRRLERMESRFDTRVKYKIDVTYKIAGMGRAEAVIDLLPTKKIPLRVPGTPPIWLDVELSAPVGISVEGTAKGESRVIYEAEYDFYATTGYNKTSGLHTDSKQKTKVNEKSIRTSTQNFELKAELFMKPNIMVRAYRIAGPYAYLQPYVRGEMELPQRHKKDDLFVGVKGGVGIEFSEPVFTTAIMSYDSGEIFDFNASFDLDGFAGAPALTASGIEKNDIYVDSIGKEGFVVINAKTLSKDTFARFELIKGTETGILVPAEDFYMSGELHYYPLPKSQSEKFVLRVTANDGTKQNVEIPLTVSENVQKEVAKERFGITTNSYRVATEGPGAHADKVPHYYTGHSQSIAAGESQIHQKEAVLRSFAIEMQNIIPMQLYKECRVKNRTHFRGNDINLFTEDRWSDHQLLNCLSKTNSIQLEKIFLIEKEQRQYAYPRTLDAQENSFIMPIAAYFDNLTADRFVDLIMNNCYQETLQVQLKKDILTLTTNNSHCLAQLRTIAPPKEGSFLANGYDSWSLKTYGYNTESNNSGFYHFKEDSNGLINIPLGRYTIQLKGTSTEVYGKKLYQDFHIQSVELAKENNQFEIIQ